MQYLVFFGTLVSTFFSIWFGMKKQWKQFMVKTGNYHIHHSVFGLAGMALSFFHIKYSRILLPAGLGMFVSHGFEEKIFNKRRMPKSFFVFVTKEEKEEPL